MSESTIEMIADTVTAIICLGIAIVIVSGLIWLADWWQRKHQVNLLDAPDFEDNSMYLLGDDFGPVPTQALALEPMSPPPFCGMISPQMLCIKAGASIDPYHYPGATYPPCPELCKECTPNRLGDSNNG